MALLANPKTLTSELVDLTETKKVVANAESRARLVQKKSDSRIGRRNNREYAQALHREADKLYHSGDYETALVLYHRAANLFPRDSSHSVAARRTAATISSCNNPSKALRKTMDNEERLTISLCPETAAILANDTLKKSPNPASVAQILSYFDTHKSLWKTLPSPRGTVNQSKKMKKNQSKQQLADQSLTNLQTTFNSGKMTPALKIAQDLILLSAGFQNPSRYQIAAYHYLSLIHVALGRHDRAVSNVSRLVRLSKSTGDEVQIYRSFVTLGKVHLSFGHLNAAAKSWEYLSKDLKEPIPVAWIRHEIGRCHLETGKYKQAMDMAVRCTNAAVKGKSKKWLLYGKLLLGVSLAKQGRFVESLEELQVAARITEEEGDTPMLSYIRNLIDQVAQALRTTPFENDYFKRSGASTTLEQTDEQQPKRSSLIFSREETVITTMYTQRMITEYRDSSSNVSVDVDEEATMRSEKTASPGRHRSTNTKEQQDAEAARGDVTFRREGTPREQSPSSSSSFNDEEEDLESDGAGNNEDVKCTSSKTSFKSANTTATYVIEGGDSKLEDKVSKAEDKDLKERILEDGYGRRMIDQLDKMEDMELLMLLKKGLLEEDWSDDFGNSGDSGREKRRTPRSGRDGKNKVAANH